jgi:THO complex subunit 2
MLKTWSPKPALSPTTFVTFVQSVLSGLPSSSSSSPSPSHVTAFGEILVDIIWSIDAELEEIVTEAKVALSSTGDQNGAFLRKEENRGKWINEGPFSRFSGRDEGQTMCGE